MVDLAKKKKKECLQKVSRLAMFFFVFAYLPYYAWKYLWHLCCYNLLTDNQYKVVYPWSIAF